MLNLTFLCLCLFLSPSLLAGWTLSHDSTKCNDTRQVHWFKADNGTSFVHFVFAADLHIRPPAIIVMHSHYSGSQVSVNCSQLNANATFRGSVTANAITASYGIVIYEVCDYVDEEDDATIKLDSHCIHHLGSNLMWTFESLETDSPAKLTATFRATHSNDSHDVFLDGGALLLKFSVFDTDSQPMDDFYYQVSGGLGVAITLTIDRLKVVESRSRVAPMLLVFSNQSLENDDDFKEVSGFPVGISDGPAGKLQTSYLILDQRVKHSPSPTTDFPSAFAQFTPASWVNPRQRDQSSLRSATLGPRAVYDHQGRAHKITYSLVYAYYKDRFNQHHQGSHEGYVGVRAQFINLGSPKDGFYRATNYSSWTMVLSLGYPSLEPNSHSGARTALLVISLLAVAGGVGSAGYWYHKRRRQNQILRYESLSHPASAVPTEPEPGSPTVMDSIEPFQRGKVGFASRWRNRFRRDGGTSRQPLLPVPPEHPPAYDSIVHSNA